MDPHEWLLIDHFEFRGFHGCRCVCNLELFSLADGRTVVIATELADNKGTSITNVVEYLASTVCDRFEIDPDKLVWIETYGYAAPGERQRTFDLVTFTTRTSDGIHWSPAVTKHKPDGWPGYFEDPEWRAMKDEDWQVLGLTPRQPVGSKS